MIHKHQFVTYTRFKLKVSAIVRRVHRDGTATVEARYILDEKGKISGCHIGHHYRMNLSDLSENA